MKAGDQPELLFQFGKSKVLAKGLDAIDAVKWPLRFVLCTVGLCLLAASYWGVPAALRFARVL